MDSEDLDFTWGFEFLIKGFRRRLILKIRIWLGFEFGYKLGTCFGFEYYN